MDNPLSLNRYAYVSNNPLRYVDPSGHRLLEFTNGSTGRINSAGLSFEDACLYWVKKTVEYADATGAPVPSDVVPEVVPAEYVAEVKTIVGWVGAGKWGREVGDVPDLGMGAPLAGAAVGAGTIKKTGTATKSPALKSSPYNPEKVAERTKPPYKANPAHDKGSPYYNPKKTPEPSDSVEVYNNSVRGGMGTWYGVNKDGKIYQFFSDNAGGVHFAGEITREKLTKDIRQQLRIK